MPRTKRNINLSVSENEIEALYKILFASIYPSDENALKAAKGFLLKLSETYYKGKIKSMKLPKLGSVSSSLNSFDNEQESQDSEVTSFPSRMLDALSLLYEENEFPLPVELNVIDGKFGERIKEKFYPTRILAITSKDKGRKKVIYYLEFSGTYKVKEYLINNNAVTFESLIKKLDPLNRVLILISRSVIANVAYYQPSGKSEVALTLKGKHPKNIQKFSLLALSDSYHLVRKEYLKRILLQKRILGYIEPLIDNSRD